MAITTKARRYKNSTKNSPKIEMKTGGSLTGAPVSQMDYLEMLDYVSKKYAPHIKNTTKVFTNSDGDLSYEYEDDSKEIFSKIDRYYREQADYTEEQLDANTNYKLDGWELYRKEYDPETDEVIDEEELEQELSDNTYNWGYLGLMDLNIRLYHDDVYEKWFYVIHPHEGGDIRGNYGKAYIIEGDDKDDLMYRFHESFIDGSISIYIKFKDDSEIVFDSENINQSPDYVIADSYLAEVETGSFASRFMADFESFDYGKGDEFVKETYESFRTNRKPTEKKSEGGSIDDNPKAYIQILGHSEGQWMDLTDSNDGDEFIQSIEDWMKDLNEEKGGLREEWEVSDWDGFGQGYYDQYMSESDFDEVYTAYSAYEGSNYSVAVIEGYMSDTGIDDMEQAISDMDEKLYGKYNNISDLAEQMVDEGVYTPSTHEMYVTDTDKRLISGEESDSRVEDMEFSDALDYAEMQDKFDARKDEIEAEESGLDSELEVLNDRLSTLESELNDADGDDYDVTAEAITEVEEEISAKEDEITEKQEEIENIPDEMDDEVREKVREVIYDETYDRLENNLEDFLNEYGYENPAEVSFIRIDHDSIGRDLESDYIVIKDTDGQNYIFQNYENGGRVIELGKPKLYDYYVIEMNSKRIVKGFADKKDANAHKKELTKTHKKSRFSVYPRSVVENKYKLDTVSRKKWMDVKELGDVGKVAIRRVGRGKRADSSGKNASLANELRTELSDLRVSLRNAEKKDRAEIHKGIQNVKREISKLKSKNYLETGTFRFGGAMEKVKGGAKKVGHGAKKAGGWMKRQWREADFGDGKGKAKFDGGGSIKGVRYDIDSTGIENSEEVLYGGNVYINKTPIKAIPYITAHTKEEAERLMDKYLTSITDVKYHGNKGRTSADYPYLVFWNDNAGERKQEYKTEKEAKAFAKVIEEIISTQKTSYAGGGDVKNRIDKFISKTKDFDEFDFDDTEYYEEAYEIIYNFADEGKISHINMENYVVYEEIGDWENSREYVEEGLWQTANIGNAIKLLKGKSPSEVKKEINELIKELGEPVGMYADVSEVIYTEEQIEEMFNNGEAFMKKDAKTGKGINRGYYFSMPDKTFANEADALEFADLQASYDEKHHYWAEWEDYYELVDSEEFYTADGEHVEFDVEYKQGGSTYAGGGETGYYQNQLNEIPLNGEFPPNIKFFSEAGSTKHLSIYSESAKNIIAFLQDKKIPDSYYQGQFADHIGKGELGFKVWGSTDGKGEDGIHTKQMSLNADSKKVLISYLKKAKKTYADGGILSTDEEEDFKSWIEDGNALEVKNGIWTEQTTQWRKEFTTDELKSFFKREYLKYGGTTYAGGGTTGHYNYFKADELWNKGWSADQRFHFLEDHIEQIYGSKSKAPSTKTLEKYSNSDWDKLPDSIQSVVGDHKADYRYADGGEVEEQLIRVLKDSGFNNIKGTPSNEYKHNRGHVIAVIGKDNVGANIHLSNYTPNTHRFLGSTTFDNPQKLAEYFDKNQIYSEGGSTYADEGEVKTSEFKDGKAIIKKDGKTIGALYDRKVFFKGTRYEDSFTKYPYALKLKNIGTREGETLEELLPFIEKYSQYYKDGGDTDIQPELGLNEKQKSEIISLPYESAIYVPSTQDVDKVVSLDEMEKRANQVKKFLSKMFGGYTSSETVGGFMDSKGQLVNEDVIKVTSFSTAEAFDDNKEKLFDQIQKWAKEWGQEAIGFEFEGNLYYVPETFQKGGDVWIQDAVQQMEKKGTTGAFTRQAKEHGMKPIPFAKEVLAHPDKYHKKTVDRASFVKAVNPEKF